MTQIPYQPTVTWLEPMPPEVRAAVEPLLECYLALVPTWCHDLLVAWDDSDHENLATCCARAEYRWARITLCASWLRQTPAAREDAIVHELTHVLTEPIQNHVRDLLEVIKEKFPDVHKWADEQRRYANESVTQDLTRILLAHRHA